MLNTIWASFMIVGILVAMFTGNVGNMTNACIEAGKDAVMLCITMLGVVSTWTGIVKIAQRGGLIESLAKKMNPLLTFLFPDVPKNHPAREYIATNLIANFLGLGWAATPAGLSAMKELQKLNREKEKASRAMCMFLIINMSSVQLISVNIIAYRAQYHSMSPAEILGPSLFATVCSTVIGVLYGKLAEGRRDG